MEAATTDRPGTRDSASAVRRDAILAAALDSFTSRGYAGTTIEDVRERSGASVGSIYHHFGGKEGLAAALYVQGLRDYQQGLLSALRANPEAEAGVRAVVRHHLRWAARHRDLARYLLAHRPAEVAVATQSGVRELNRAFFVEVNAWIDRHVGAGALRRLPRDLYHSLLLGPSHDYVRLWLDGRVAASLRAAEPHLAEAAWNSLAAKEDER